MNLSWYLHFLITCFLFFFTYVLVILDVVVKIVQCVYFAKLAEQQQQQLNIRIATVCKYTAQIVLNCNIFKDMLFIEIGNVVFNIS